MKTIKKIIYTAGVIIDNSNISSLVSIQYENVYCHHMTIQYGNIEQLPNNLGQEINFISKTLVYDNNAMALIGSTNNDKINKNMSLINQIPHIIIYTATGIKPVYSNNLIKSKSSIRSSMELIIPMKIGAFVLYIDNTTDWIFNN